MVALCVVASIFIDRYFPRLFVEKRVLCLVLCVEKLRLSVAGRRTAQHRPAESEDYIQGSSHIEILVVALPASIHEQFVSAEYVQ